MLKADMFLYIVLFCGIGVFAYLITPIPYLNVIIAGIFVGIGLLFAFFKYNERGLDIWIKNIFVRLFSPSQYFYKKNNSPPVFLQNIPQTDKLVIETQIDAQKKINKYLEGVDPQITKTVEPKNQTEVQLKDSIEEIEKSPDGVVPSAPIITVKDEPTEQENTPVSVTTGPNDTPYLSGTVSNQKGVHLPDIMLYIKNQLGESVRMLKTNQNGAFLSYTELEDGEYTIQIKDPRGVYFFDTMTLQIKSGSPLLPLTITSKEVI